MNIVIVISDCHSSSAWSMNGAIRFAEEQWLTTTMPWFESVLYSVSHKLGTLHMLANSKTHFRNETRYNVPVWYFHYLRLSVYSEFVASWIELHLVFCSQISVRRNLFWPIDRYGKNLSAVDIGSFQTTMTFSHFNWVIFLCETIDFRSVTLE